MGRENLKNNSLEKWTSLINVYEDWKLIAETWKYLNLKCQLTNEWDDSGNDIDIMEEMGYVYDKPIIEFHIHDRTVDIKNPDDILVFNTHKSIIFDNILFNCTKERGCDINTLKYALTYTKSQIDQSKLI